MNIGGGGGGGGGRSMGLPYLVTLLLGRREGGRERGERKR